MPIITNKSPVTLDQVTPLARIVGEYEIVVVPVDSPIQTLADLVAKLKADPGAVSWGGGSVGSTDHILAGLIMKAVGADLAKLNYIAHSGGGEALTSILGGHVTVGISGYGEFGPQVDAGKLRALAVSSEERLPGVDIPTLKEQGLDVAFFNWRGLFAAAGHPAADLEALADRDHRHGREPGLEGHGRRAAVDRPLPAGGRVRRLPQGGPRRDGRHPDRPRSRQVRHVAWSRLPQATVKAMKARLATNHLKANGALRRG